MEKSDEQEKFATIPTWAKLLSLLEESIRARVDNRVAILGRNTRGQIQRFFAESHIIETCQDILENLPTANVQGYFTLPENDQVIVYGNPVYWAAQFGISHSEISRRVKALKGIDGRSCVGRVCRNGFFSESQVRPLIEDLLIEAPKLNEEGWLIIDWRGRRNATELCWVGPRNWALAAQHSERRSMDVKAWWRGIDRRLASKCIQRK